MEYLFFAIKTWASRLPRTSARGLRLVAATIAFWQIFNCDLILRPFFDFVKQLAILIFAQFFHEFQLAVDVVERFAVRIGFIFKTS